MKEFVNVLGINYSKPKVILLNENGIGSAEFAGRVAYDSFEYSEHESIRELNNLTKLNETDDINMSLTRVKRNVNGIENSELLDSLAWVYHHHSVIEHSSLTFLITGTSRGSLQEIVRHRIASYTVRSTRYTMSSVLYAFLLAVKTQTPREVFHELITPLDLFVTDDNYNGIEIDAMFNKLLYQRDLDTDNFAGMCLSKEALIWYNTVENVEEIYKGNSIQKSFEILSTFKKKRNVGDSFKHLVTDNWKTDLVMTINLRSLKNFFELRDSGAAYFLIRELAKEMKAKTPKKYLNLMVKEH